jgi:DNA/RNA endonuclease YhcR with UshA esterase domain
VTRYPDYDPVAEQLTFWLDDGTGTILVILSRDEAQALIDRGQVPTIGDRVSIAGIARARTTRALGDFVSLTVRDSARLEIEASEPVESLVAEAADAEPYSRVLVKGQVSEVWQSYEGLTVLRIHDDTGEIDIVCDQDLVWISGAPTTVLPGDAVSARGVVTIHDGQSQIVLDTASGLKRLPAPAPQASALQATVAPTSPSVTATASRALAAASATATVPGPSPTAAALATATPRPAVRVDAGRAPGAGDESGALRARPVQTGLLSEVALESSATIEGRIERATLLSAGCKSIVNDGSGPAAVWMPNTLYEQLVDPEGWNVGAVVRVAGRVSEYEGELEVVPQSVDAVVIVQRALPVTASDVQIGALSVADGDRRVTVEGEIVSADPFSAGIKVVLDDGSGRVTLLLWQNIVQALPDREALAVGARVRASGWVQEYRGELEITPGLASDVTVLGTP